MNNQPGHTLFNYSEACERNRGPILDVLTRVFADRSCVLEVGSGTGQHAVFFAGRLSHLVWQPSDLSENIASLTERIAHEGSDNLRKPLTLNVAERPWPISGVDAIFSANCLHIMSWEHVIEFFSRSTETLVNGGLMCIYGPFRYEKKYTSESNAKFDRSLKMRDPLSGIRDFESVNELAEKGGFSLVQDFSMPANNQLLVWTK